MAGVGPGSDLKADRKLDGLFAYRAVVYAAALLLATGFIADQEPAQRG